MKEKNIKLHYLFFIFMIAVFIACNSKPAEKDYKIPEGMVMLDLKNYGKPFSLPVPDTTKAKLIVEEQTSGELIIRVGNSYAISISEQQADLNLIKADLKDNEVNKFKRFIKDDSNSLFWESEIVQPEFHFVANRKISGRDYSFRDFVDGEGRLFNQQAIQVMYDCCDQLRLHEEELNF